MLFIMEWLSYNLCQASFERKVKYHQNHGFMLHFIPNLSKIGLGLISCKSFQTTRKCLCCGLVEEENSMYYQ